MGKTEPEVIGHKDSEFLEGTDGRNALESDQGIIAEGKTVTLEETITFSGVTRTYHTTKAPLRDANGTVAGMIGIARDVTDRRAATDSIQASEKRYRELTNAIPQIVWTAATDGAITHVNDKAVEYTGLNEASLAGWSWEQVVHPGDSRRQFRNGHWRLLRACRERSRCVFAGVMVSIAGIFAASSAEECRWNDWLMGWHLHTTLMTSCGRKMR